jgi:hypothetical protein
MLKTGFVELGFPPFLAPLLLILSKGNRPKWGYLANYCSVLPEGVN